MSNKVANAGYGETGGWYQQPGDQTGTEVCVKDFYVFSGGLDNLLYYPDETISWNMARDAVKLCNCNLVGYDQVWEDRNSLYRALRDCNWSVDAYIKSGKKTETDCSAFVYTIACIYIPAMRAYYNANSNCTTTYVMNAEWTKYGWKKLKDSKYLTTGNYQHPFYVYLVESHHTNAAVNWGAYTGKDTSLPTGSSTATSSVATTVAVTTSTCTKKYKTFASSLNIRASYGTNYEILGSIPSGVVVAPTLITNTNWAKVTYNGVTGWISLTYAKEYTETTTTATTTAATTTSGGFDMAQLATLKKGSKGQTVKAAQILLNGNGYSCGSYGCDGDFGSATQAAVNKFKKANGLTEDGQIDSATWAKLLGVN